ncbi:MAG: ATP-binding protein [Candidatus Nanopelagicales bacterium]|nr:ATP-binding protein [Candidatus Nanopelagicales bacterium]MDZ4249922.1 ATP-binding protein [Candidatus Nanopelagicales bacterium]
MAAADNLVARHASRLVAEALRDTRVVLVQGARQVGKSTLATRLVDLPGAEVRTLDDVGMLEAARTDPVGFVETPGPLVIDEIQRAPELLLAIKSRVDRDPRPGQFLLTGSAQVLATRRVADSLPGRVETISLWPLSQGEIDVSPDQFLDAVFQDGPDFTHTTSVARSEYLSRLTRGGFPDARNRSARRLQAFLDSYTRSIVDRDVRDLSQIERAPQLRALLPMLAARSGSLMMPAGLANKLAISRPTVARYLALLQEVFLIAAIPAWSRNVSARATSASKLAFVDSGIAANLLGETPESLARPQSHLGPLLEGFVAMELARQATWSDVRVELSHYRTKDGVEVDLIAEDRSGAVIAIEVKASSTVRSEDFRGIHHLRERIGDDLRLGIVLHAGTNTLAFGPGLKAVPIAAIWEAGRPK